METARLGSPGEIHLFQNKLYAFGIYLKFLNDFVFVSIKKRAFHKDHKGQNIECS